MGLLKILALTGGTLAGGSYVDHKFNGGRLTNSAKEGITTSMPGFAEWAGDIAGRGAAETSQIANEAKLEAWMGKLENLAVMWNTLMSPIFGPETGLYFINLFRSKQEDRPPLGFDGEKLVPIAEVTNLTNIGPDGPIPPGLDGSRLAADGHTPITPENAMSADNLLTWDPSVEGALHKAHVISDAIFDTGVKITAIPFQGLDALDHAIGGIWEKVTGRDNGYEERDLSKAWEKSTDELYHSIIPRAELSSAWDRVLFNGVNIGSYFIPGVGAARLASDASQGAENYLQTGHMMKNIYD